MATWMAAIGNVGFSPVGFHLRSMENSTMCCFCLSSGHILLFSFYSHFPSSTIITPPGCHLLASLCTVSLEEWVWHSPMLSANYSPAKFHIWSEICDSATLPASVKNGKVSYVLFARRMAPLDPLTKQSGSELMWALFSLVLWYFGSGLQ